VVYCVYTLNTGVPSRVVRDDPDTVEVRSMERTTVVVRKYTSIAAFKADEQKLGQAGWSADATVNPYQKQSVVNRIRAFFTRTPAPLIVTYHREPSVQRATQPAQRTQG
jgi:hypothetical protein